LSVRDRRIASSAERAAKEEGRRQNLPSMLFRARKSVAVSAASSADAPDRPQSGSGRRAADKAARAVSWGDGSPVVARAGNGPCRSTGKGRVAGVRGRQAPGGRVRTWGCKTMGSADCVRAADPRAATAHDPRRICVRRQTPTPRVTRRGPSGERRPPDILEFRCVRRSVAGGQIRRVGSDGRARTTTPAKRRAPMKKEHSLCPRGTTPAGCAGASKECPP